MVGVLMDKPSTAEKQVQANLSAPDNIAALKMQKHATGGCLISPSGGFPGIASFGTRHQRDGDADIVVSHIFFNFPHAPAKAKAKAKLKAKVKKS